MRDTACRAQSSESCRAQSSESCRAQSSESCRAQSSESLYSPLNNPANLEQFGKPVHGSIPTIVRSFKSAVTKEIHEITGTTYQIWQRNYWEHIIRNHRELNLVRLYIRNNPVLWELDRLNGGVGNQLDLERVR